MKLEEVEEKLGTIYSIASVTQGEVRTLISEEWLGFKLTPKQKKELAERINARFKDIAKLASELKVEV